MTQTVLPFYFFQKYDRIENMKYSIKRLSKISISIFVLFLFFSCHSVVVIPEDASAKQLIQSGQDEFSSGNYKNALRFYNATLERYGDDPSIFVEAKYEIGHIYMKQKKYDYAENVFTEILSLYANTLPGQLPGAYQKLSQFEIEKIAEKRK